MNEKRFLYLILTLFFMILSVMTVMVMISQNQQKMFEFLLEYEKLLNHFYQSYNEGEIDELVIPDDIRAVGLYNYNNKPLFTYGDAPLLLREKDRERPHFSKDHNTIIVARDLLNPFIPIISDDELVERIHSNLLNRASTRPEEEKQTMVRYVYIEISDAPVMLFRRKSQYFIILVIVLILIIVIYMGNLYLRNMKYRNQIESQERLVMMGTAARTLTHEIKNPLSSIRLQTSIIRRSGCGPP